MLYYSYYTSPVGKLLMLADQESLIHLAFELEQGSVNPNWERRDQLELFQWVKSKLTAYFLGRNPDFSDLPLAPQGTVFQQQVWQVLRAIPYGQSTHYAAIAQQLNKPQAIRAVGGAVGRNPISIIIPCHRVLGKNRHLTGFGGGLPIKRQLLQLEGIGYQDKGVEFVQPKSFKFAAR